MIVIDGARIDRLNQSEEFTNVISRGTLFSKMITYAPYTLASMTATFSGMYGTRNGVDAYSKMFQYKDDVKFLAEYFKDNGWYTRGAAMRLSLVPERGFSNLTAPDEKKTDYVVAHNKIIDDLIIDKNNSEPFFLYLHYPKIHTSLVKNVFDVYDDFSKEYFDNSEKNMENYDNYLGEAGIYLKQIFTKLESHNLPDNSIIIVMADHGMGVGEKIGERAYGVFTYDYSIRSFASFIQKDLFPEGKIVENLTRTVDIMPTLLEITGIKQDYSFKDMHGTSLMSLLPTASIISKIRNHFSGGRTSFSETGGVYGPWPSPSEPNVKCVRTEDWKLIHNLSPDTWELYDLKNDPSENNNLVKSRIDKFRKLASIMKKINS